MKKQNTRAMTGEERDVKMEEAFRPTVNPPKVLRCTRDSDMPGIGFFKCGDTVDDQRKVAQIADNPNFEEVKGGKS